MTLQLELATVPPEPIDARPLTPDRLADLDRSSVSRLPVRVGRQTLPLGELFRVSGTPGERIEFSGHTQLIDFIAAEMQRGTIVVDGDAGLLTASQLKGGTVHIMGSSGAGTASAMRGGMLTVDGDAADDCAAALGAETLGMRGGVFVVHGNAGRRFAARMRRGTAIVVGAIGDDACSQMVAGTVVGLAGFAARPALGMRRGTLVTRSMPEPFPAWFSTPERYVSSFSRMLVQMLGDLLPANSPAMASDFERSLGDLSVGGQGELLIGRE